MDCFLNYSAWCAPGVQHVLCEALATLQPVPVSRLCASKPFRCHVSQLQPQLQSGICVSATPHAWACHWLHAGARTQPTAARISLWAGANGHALQALHESSWLERPKRVPRLCAGSRSQLSAGGSDDFTEMRRGLLRALSARAMAALQPSLSRVAAKLTAQAASSRHGSSGSSVAEQLAAADAMMQQLLKVRAAVSPKYRN